MRWPHTEQWDEPNYAVRGARGGPDTIAGEFMGGPWREENSGATTGAGHVTRNPLPNDHELIVLRMYRPGQQCNFLN